MYRCVFDSVYVLCLNWLIMRVNIWIPERELDRIDSYCKSHQYHRSTFLWKSAVNLINDLEGNKEKIRCDYCRAESIGRYEVTAYTDHRNYRKTSRLD